MVCNPKEHNSKSDQTILITNDTLYISPLHAEDREGKLSVTAGEEGVKVVNMTLLYWWEKGAMFSYVG